MRHAYFPGTNNDPYKSLKTTLKAEINRKRGSRLHLAPQRHLTPVRQTGIRRIAVKVINHLGDEVMKVF